MNEATHILIGTNQKGKTVSIPVTINECCESLIWVKHAEKKTILGVSTGYFYPESGKMASYRGQPLLDGARLETLA